MDSAFLSPGSIPALGLGAVFSDLLPAYALGQEGSAGPTDVLAGDRIALEIAERRIAIGPREASATGVNGTIPGPLIRLREGQDVVIDVTNRSARTAPSTGTESSNFPEWTACPE